LVLTITVSLALTSAVYLGAASSETLKVNIPFAFHVDKKVLPAGTYTVRIDRATSMSALGTALVIQTPDGKIWHRITTTPGYRSGLTGQASLTFNRYADSYFLSSVESFSVTCELRRSSAEKEMAARMNPLEKASVAAE